VFDRVTKAFPRTERAGGTFDAVRDLSFTVRRGELLAILGRTGCGKSTTFNLISGLLRPTSGRVTVKGRDPFVQFEWFRGKIGIVFQNDRLLPWAHRLRECRTGSGAQQSGEGQACRNRDVMARSARTQ